MKIKNDIQVIELIKKLYLGIPNDEEEWAKVLETLEIYQPGLVDFITQSEELEEPARALALARERNKPIVL